MKYDKIVSGRFIKRHNRFVGTALVDGVEEKVHIKNTGRCAELLQEGAEIHLEDHTKSVKNRKTRYSLVTVKKPSTGVLANIDSQAPNKVVEEALLSGRLHLKEMTYPITVKREQKYMDSRFDFYIEDSAGQQAYMEVKGVTLENDGIAMFPDAPTMRGAKHLKELIAAKQEGFISYAIFVIQMKGIDFFKTNAANDPDFDAAYCAARKAGVHIKAFDCIITPDSIVLDNEIKTL